MRNKKFKVKVGVVALTAVAATGIFAATQFLTWGGAQIITETKQFIKQATTKIIDQDALVKSLKAKRDELQAQLDELLSNGSQDNETITQLQQQIVELNNTIIQKENIIIEKDNEINHLKEQLILANEQIYDQQTILKDEKERLDEAGINLYWTEQP